MPHTIRLAFFPFHTSHVHCNASLVTNHITSQTLTRHSTLAEINHSLTLELRPLHLVNGTHVN